MPNVLAALLGKPEQRQTGISSWSWTDYLASVGSISQTLIGNEERVGTDFKGYAVGAHRSNGIVFSVMQVRAMVFSQARFMYRQLADGRPGELFSTPALDLLRNPWPGGTTADLLARAIQDVDLAGNFYATVRGTGPNRRIVRLRPDWMTISLSGDPEDIDTVISGYQYHPDGQKPVELDINQVAHFAPIPDPLARYRGMSWLTPILREVEADIQATQHKRMFFRNGATPNMVVKFAPEVTEQQAKDWKSLFEDRHRGADNAYRTAYIGGGADVQVVGKDFAQLDFKATQGAGETRIAMAGGVHPVVLGASEGMQGSSLNAGNYGQARRNMSDITLAWLWQNMAGSFSKLVRVPNNAELWYDDTIPFLQDDARDTAEIQQKDSLTIRQLVDAGFLPDSVVDAVTAGDMKRLEHSGLYSVQLQPANSQEPANVND